jgi:ferredoxin-NADP reductase
MMSSTTTYISHLLDRGEVAEETMAFHLERPAEFEFRAGQYIEVTLLAPPETDEEGNTRALSLVNAPSARELVVATRMRDTAFKRSLRGMATGTQLRIEGPMGSFTLHKNVSRASVLIAGGIGVPS